MTEILIILQGLLYTGLLVTLVSRWGERFRPGAAGILGGAAVSLAAHLLFTLIIPAEWRVTWFVFVIPGHILTPALLLFLARRNTAGG
jgi:hypothetical protein